MIYHFSIGLQEAGRDQAVSAILDKARADPTILHVERGPGAHWVVFCQSPKMAQLERRCYEQSRSVGPARCMLVIDSRGIHISQEGEDPRWSGLAGFVTWIFRSLPISRVVDWDTNEDLTELAKSQPDKFFT